MGGHPPPWGVTPLHGGSPPSMVGHPPPWGVTPLQETRKRAIKRGECNDDDDGVPARRNAARNDASRITLHRLMYQLSFGSIAEKQRQTDVTREHFTDLDRKLYDRLEAEAAAEQQPTQKNKKKLRMLIKRNRLEIVLHSCDNKRCFNPDHLYLASRRENKMWAEQTVKQQVFNRRRKELGLWEQRQQMGNQAFEAETRHADAQLAHATDDLEGQISNAFGRTART